MLKPKQYKAISMLLDGKTQQEVADELKYHRTTISSWMRNDAEFREEYESQLRQLMNVLASEATATIADLMRNANNENVKLNACKDILSRAGYEAATKNKVELEKTDIVITIDE